MAIGQIQFRRDTEANLKSAGATLLEAGEIGYAEDKNYFAIGDGSTVFALLPIYEPSPVIYDKVSGRPDLSIFARNVDLAASFDQLVGALNASSLQQRAVYEPWLESLNVTVNDLQIIDNGILERLIVQELRVSFSGSYLDLSNKPVIPAAQQSVDWNATAGNLQVLNKPVIPAAQQSVDWNATAGNLQVLNKPVIPAAQQSVDWNATTGNLQVLNKPVIPVLPGINNQTTFTSQATVPLVAQIAVGTAKLFKVGTAAPKWYANDAGVIRAV
jgi:hypothetical protein